MKHTYIDKSYAGRGTKIGAAAVAGRPWITAQAADVRLDVDYDTLRRACQRLKIPKHGRFWRIDDEALERLRPEVSGAKSYAGDSLKRLR